MASPWIAETALTPDLLHASDYEYLLDWSMDNQPELIDSSAIIGRQVDCAGFASMIIDQFDEMRQTPDGKPWS